MLEDAALPYFPRLSQLVFITYVSYNIQDGLLQPYWTDLDAFHVAGLWRIL